MHDTKVVDGFDRGDCPLTIGDNVMVRKTPITEAAGIAGAMAQVMGETTPSVTGVEVIGKPKRDYAVAIWMEGTDGSYWIDPDLLEFKDHGPGTTMTLAGVSGEWTRDADGQWRQSRVGFIERITRCFRKRK